MIFYFPIHLDGGNRGCEAIAKGTAVLLGKPKEQLVGLCRDVALDSRLGINSWVTLYTYPLWRKIYNKFYNKFHSMFDEDLLTLTSHNYACTYGIFLSRMGNSDMLFSTGGDMMCYGDNEVNYTNNLAYAKGAKSVLWGCSIGKENLTPSKIETLKKFTLIYARETLTANMLREELGLDNVVVYPDPAFILEPEKVELPACFSNGKVVGINLSNYVLDGFTLNSKLGQDVVSLIHRILNDPDQQVLLIPHVMWKDQDDRIIGGLLFDLFKSTGRVHLLDSDSLNYCQLRHVIASCHIFIGARTHAVISAYSTCVPSIALGYSIKSVGIATDLSMPMETVVDSKNYKRGALLDAYSYVDSHYSDLKHTLESLMSDYKESTKGIKNVIESL